MYIQVIQCSRGDLLRGDLERGDSLSSEMMRVSSSDDWSLPESAGCTVVEANDCSPNESNWADESNWAGRPATVWIVRGGPAFT